jgi:hypothetical protein
MIEAGGVCLVVEGFVLFGIDFHVREIDVLPPLKTKSSLFKMNKLSFKTVPGQECIIHVRTIQLHVEQCRHQRDCTFAFKTAL